MSSRLYNSNIYAFVNMKNFNSFCVVIFIALKVNFIKAGIDVPKTECAWINGDYGKEIKCDGNQVVVGACG